MPARHEFRRASDDRKMVWSRRYVLFHPDGTVETWTVEKVSVLDPKTQQAVKIRRGQLTVMVVYPASRQFYERGTMRPVKYTHYYIFSQSFMGGPGSRGDILGGFVTGRFLEMYEPKYKEFMVYLRKNKFKRET